jgi:hypothetical protein
MADQFHTHDNAAAPGIALVSSLMTNRSTIATNPHGASSLPNVQPAAGLSTAPYVPPARRGNDVHTASLCEFGDCKAFTLSPEQPYCAAHARMFGLVDQCEASDTCRGMVVEGTGLCARHQPTAEEAAT